MRAQYEHSLGRRILFPIFGLDQAIFASLALFGAGVSAYFLDVPAPILTLSGGAGLWAVGYFTSPAYFIVRNGAMPDLEKQFHFHKLKVDAHGDWIPTIPRWLRWERTKIVLDHISQHEVKISGPMSMISLLVDD